MRKEIFLLNILMISIGASFQNNAGIKTRISKSGLNFAANFCENQFASVLNTISIPDITENNYMITYSVTNLKIIHITKPIVRIVPDAGTGISVSLSNSTFKLGLDWKYNGWFGIKDSGTGYVETKSIFVSTTLKIKRDENGKPEASVHYCNSAINGFYIQIKSGRFSSMYNLIISLFENKIKNLIQDEICNNLNKRINQDVNIKLASLITKVEIDSQIFVNFMLTDNPIFTSEYLEMSFAGEFFSNTGIKYTEIAPHMEINMDNNKMINLAISEWVFNSAAYIFQRLGRLNQILQINNKNISQPLIELLHLKGNNENLKLQIEATEAPFIHITTSSFIINATVNIQLQNITGKHLLSVKASMLLECEIHFDSNTIKGKVINIQPKIQIDESAQVSGQSSERFIDILVGLLRQMLPSLNERTVTGFLIPSFDGLALMNPILRRYDGHVVFESDILSQLGE